MDHQISGTHQGEVVRHECSGDALADTPLPPHESVTLLMRQIIVTKALSGLALVRAAFYTCLVSPI